VRSESDDKSFMKRQDYGKIPDYLSKVKDVVSRERKLVEECVKENNEGDGTNSNPDYVLMDEEERQILIDNLKSKWDQVNSKYQKLCHRVTNNSLGDIKRKEAQEAELQQLEDDIEKLSKTGPLYINKT